MSKTLNTHVHRLVADHTSYNNEMNKSARSTSHLAKGNQSLVSSIALVDGPLGGVASRVANLNSIFSRGGLILGTFAVGVSAVGFGLVKTLAVMSEVEVEMNKINNLIRATGGSTGFLAEEFDAMARSVALDTMASTTEIRQAIASLMTFKGVGSEIFESTIRLSQDMAAVWGGSAATNARKLGKAMEDPIKQLSRLETTVGAFDSASREAILTMAKTGDKAGAQAKILSTLEDRIKGAGNAFGLPGAKDTLTQKWTEFFEAVGNSTGVGSFAAREINNIANGIERINRAIDPTTEDQLFKAFDKRNLLGIKRATEQAELERLQSLPKSRMNDIELATQKKILDNIDIKVKQLNSEIALLENKRGIEDASFKARKEEAQQNELNHKAEMTRLEREEEKKKQTELREKTWIDFMKMRSDALSKAEEDQQKKREQMHKDFEKLRESGLSQIERENELNKNNVVFLEDYKKAFGETEQLKKAAMAEELRHIQKMNELTLDKDMSFLSGRLGEAANDGIDVDSMDKENEQHQLRMRQLWGFGQEELANTEAVNKLIEEEQERHGKAVTDIKIKEEEEIAKAKSNFWSAGMSLMNAQSRKLFELGKIAAISNAVISGTESAVHAYKWGSQFGGPVLGAAFAATSLAATTVQIQAINNTQFGGGASSGSGAISVAEPAFQAPTDSRKEVNFIFNGNISGMDADHIANMLKEHIDSTDFVLIESSSRNGQELAA